jgi:hypothetical protein
MGPVERDQLMGDLQKLSDLLAMQSAREDQVFEYTWHVTKRLRRLGIKTLEHQHDKSTKWSVQISWRGRLFWYTGPEGKTYYLGADQCAEVMSNLHKTIKAMLDARQSRQSRLDEALKVLQHTKAGMDRDELG